MSTRSRRFHRKLRDCLGLTRVGAIAAATSVGMAGDSDASPVRVQVNETLPVFSSKSYDLNSDGRDDITFDFISYGDWYIDPLDYSPPGTTAVGVTGVVILDADEIFTQAYAVGEQIPGVGTLGAAGALHTLDTGPFYNQSSPRFAGLWLALGDTTGGVAPTRHFAWAELNVTPSYDLEVVAFGYETVADVPILAGSPSSSVPAAGAIPVGLGLLAAGAWMVRKKRRQE